MHCWSPQAPADNVIITYPQEIELHMVFFSKNLSTFILHSSSAQGERRDSALGLLLGPDTEKCCRIVLVLQPP